MKRVNSESNAKQGLSIAESCASSTTVKRYTINCHYDMVISVDVIAESEQQALELARKQADRKNLQHDAMCVKYEGCITDVEDMSKEELRRMEREAVQEAVRHDIDYMADDERMKERLADIAFRGAAIHWALFATTTPTGTGWTHWLQQMWREIAREEREGTALYNRYARMYARHEFDTRYKNFAKSLYEADVNGCDKLQKKQAVIDGVRCLCDKMEEYVTRQDDPDYKGWEPQMVIRYESTTGDEENYWNLFVYCTGPNDHDDNDYLSLRTSWQHVWTDEDGKDATDDYGSEEHETRAALLRYLFYGDAQEFDETDETVSWERMTDVWVD